MKLIVQIKKMSNDIEKGFNLVRLTETVLSLKNQVGNHIIQLGKCLSEVRKNLPKGEWMDWLKYEVKIPYTHAWRYMKIASEVDMKTLETVGYKKLVDILELPPSTFRDDLLELAPTLNREDIKEIKETYRARERNSDIVTEEDREINRNLEDVDTALEANAVLLDALHRIDVLKLSSDYFDLITTQLQGTPLHINEFLLNVESKVKTK